MMWTSLKVTPSMCWPSTPGWESSSTTPQQSVEVTQGRCKSAP